MGYMGTNFQFFWPRKNRLFWEGAGGLLQNSNWLASDHPGVAYTSMLQPLFGAKAGHAK